MSLKSQFLLRTSLAAVLVPAMLFVSAGSVKFWQGWAFLAVFLVPVLVFMSYLYKHDPQLMKRRIQMKEKFSSQNLIQAAAPLLFAATFVLSGLDHRFGWSRTSLGSVPLWVTLLSECLVLSGVLLVFWVMRVNSFAARTIRVEAGQPVISSGPYRFVRHPMYLGAVVMCLAIPLGLGSWTAFPACALFVPIIVFRLLFEEKFLRRELPGYSEYCLRTRFRLVPRIW